MAQFIKLREINSGSIQLNIQQIAYFHQEVSATVIYLWSLNQEGEPLVINARESYLDIKQLIKQAQSSLVNV